MCTTESLPAPLPLPEPITQARNRRWWREAARGSTRVVFVDRHRQGAAALLSRAGATAQRGAGRRPSRGGGAAGRARAERRRARRRRRGRRGAGGGRGHHGAVSFSCVFVLWLPQGGAARSGKTFLEGGAPRGRLRAAAAHPPRPGVQLTASTAADGAGWGWAARPALPLFGSASGERLLPARSRAAGLLAGARAAALLRCRHWAIARWSPCMQPLSAANPRPSRARARLRRWALR